MAVMRGLAIIVLAVACYANALNGSFHFDDGHAIQENPSIRTLDVGRFFSDVSTFSVMPQNQSYRPLLLISYAVTAAITGVQPLAFIAVNLLIHVLCALVLFAALKEVLWLIGRACRVQTIAFLAALLFAAHPLFSECVNYVSARSESLSGLLMLVSLYSYLRGRVDERWMPAAVLAIAAAMLVKPVAIVLPAILVLLEVSAAGRRPVRQVAPWLGAIAATALMTALIGVWMTPALTLDATSGFSRAEYLRSELPAYWHYVRLFVWPAGQSADPDYPVVHSIFEPRAFVAGTALLAAAAFAAWGIVRRRCTGSALAVAWFLICLAPASSFMPLAEIVNEHRPYLAAASLCALAAGALVELLPRALRVSGPRATRATVVASVVVLAALGTATHLRNRAWRTEETLWADVVSQAPGSTRAQTNLGVALIAAGKPDEAEPHLREAVRLSPAYAYARMSLGTLLLGRGDSSEALAQLDRALVLDPNLFWAHYHRGMAAERLDAPAKERSAYFSAATRLSPNFADAWYHLGLALDAMQDLEGALEAAGKAVALRGSFDDRLLLAYLLLEDGHMRAAQRLLAKLQSERPDDARTKAYLALVAQRSQTG